MTSEALRAEAKKLKSQKIVFAVFVGFLPGIAVWQSAATSLPEDYTIESPKELTYFLSTYTKQNCT